MRRERRRKTRKNGKMGEEGVAHKGGGKSQDREKKKGEDYLNDVFEMAATEYNAAEMVAVDDPNETECPNDPWQLAQLERPSQRRPVRALLPLCALFAEPAGVTIHGKGTEGPDGQEYRVHLFQDHDAPPEAMFISR